MLSHLLIDQQFKILTLHKDDDVTEAQNNGTNTIQRVPLTPVKRQNAIATINAKADEQKRLIQANNNATTEEKLMQSELMKQS